MDTKVSNNIVEPRSYQLYGDDIESKQAVEPISIVAGIGPICGFNYLDISNNERIVISGYHNPGIDFSIPENNIVYDTSLDYPRIGNKKSVIADKTNRAGVVVNAYVTPDGLIHIAPDVITINNGPTGGWPDISTNNSGRAVVFALKVKHFYTDQETDNTTPTQDDFEVTWIDSSNINLSEIIQCSYENLISKVLPEGWLDYNVETLLGIYIVGWDNSWSNILGNNSDIYKQTLYKACSHKLGLIPYNGKWPSTYSLVLNRLVTVNQMENSIEELKNNLLSYIADKSITANKLADKSITANKLADELSYMRDYVMGSIALKINATSEAGGKPTIQIESSSDFHLEINYDNAYWGKDKEGSLGKANNSYLYLELFKTHNIPIANGTLVYELVPSSVQVGMDYGPVTGLRELVSQTSSIFYKSETIGPHYGTTDGLEVLMPGKDKLAITVYGVDHFNANYSNIHIKLYIAAKFKRYIHKGYLE